MEIIETDSTLMFKNASEGMLNILSNLPWTLFYYEINLSNMLFKNKLFPLNNEFDLDEISELIAHLKDENDELEISINLYFYK